MILLRVTICSLTGLILGMMATLANALILDTAKLFHVVTAQGGLLMLLGQVSKLLAGVLPMNMAQYVGDGANGLVRHPAIFHWLMGLGLSVTYACVAPAFKLSPLRKSLLFGAFIWLVNSSVVLPLVGDGFAGSRSVSLLGASWFASGHLAFFTVPGISWQAVQNRVERVLAYKFLTVIDAP